MISTTKKDIYGIKALAPYIPPLLLSNGHLLTIYPSLFRRVSDVIYHRERIITPDNDFLDLDRINIGASRTAILTHGLEGNSHRSYMLGMARALSTAGWNVVAWNFRGCSGEPNRLLKSYHSGASDDLDIVVRHILAEAGSGDIALVGFSLGGNVTLKYLGEYNSDLNERIRAAVVFSVPSDLADSARALARPANSIYMRRFLVSLSRKMLEHEYLMTHPIDRDELRGMRTFHEFDDRFTAPIHGFHDAADYWARCSSRGFIERIARPTLLVNALDDPFLEGGCYPHSEADANPFFTLETPRHGGHVGFVTMGSQQVYWSELRTIAFLNGALGI